MDKSHNSDTPNMFETALSDTPSDPQRTPESDTRELTMEDMSCQTGDDLLENGTEAEEDPTANQNGDEQHQNEAETANQDEAENENDAEPAPSEQEDHVTGDQPIRAHGARE